MKAILIARVSTEEQKEAGNSLPAQIHRLEQYCKNRGFEILRTCSFDESAYLSNRTEFDAIIDYALNQKEKIAICCDKVDRLSRNTFYHILCDRMHHFAFIRHLSVNCLIIKLFHLSTMC